VSEETFFCRGCGKYKYVSVKAPERTPAGREVCMKCHTLALRHKNAAQIRVKNGNSSMTLAAKKCAVAKAVAKKYRAGYVPPWAKND
jgi:RNase P subunit RPR2